MTEDSRCCGTGTCLINAEGVCWCGQRWDGKKMCFSDQPLGHETAAPLSSPDSKDASGAKLDAL